MSADIAQLNRKIEELLREAEATKVDVAALRKDIEARLEPCKWHEDGWNDYWSAECGGGEWILDEGTPKSNDMSFCCFCGHPLVEVPFVPEDDIFAPEDEEPETA